MSAVFADILKFITRSHPQTQRLLCKVMCLLGGGVGVWGVLTKPSHRSAPYYSPVLGLAPSCQGLGTNAEEAGEKGVLGRKLATLMETEQPQQVLLLKQPQLLILSRKKSTQQVTWANKVEISSVQMSQGRRSTWERCFLKCSFLQEELVFLFDEKGEKEQRGQSSPKNPANSLRQS